MEKPSGDSKAIAAPLEERIAYWFGRGFRLTVQTPTTAQLVKPRRFNPAEFIVMPIYVLEYLGQRDQVVYLSLQGGQVNEHTLGMEKSAYRRAQEMTGPQRLVTAIFVVAIILLALWVAGTLFR